MPRKGTVVIAGWEDEANASMRPGLLCPGKDPQLRTKGDGGRAASMRPGLLCPGKAWLSW